MENSNFNYTDLLNEVLANPGKLSEAYSLFYRYSVANQLLLQMQGCSSPVATFKKWAELGRNVKRGAKAKYILIPSTFTQTKKEEDKEELEITRLYFKYKNCIFTLDDTDGKEYTIENKQLPNFDKTKLLLKLDITEIPFSKINGNMQGYALPQYKLIALNPLCQEPIKTTLHEIAHCLLHGRDSDNEVFNHGSALPKSIKEYEAESTAYIVGTMLNILSDQAREYSRGYIQDWVKDDLGKTSKIPESSVRRIFGAVDKIIKALES
jgi:antirestriction protein ArdC